ncbi:HEAT repeat domain-containing protein [Gimesia chilikensis]|uniref:HEAT repeat protein n=1 Tax=Gimesia chilikensis TaxID=2605989 RepID=A0A517PYD9_9PLAN|nr:HEAT repeat domain-containing protein [Gimesia chilikensis]QDT24391.1 HEAT repeat protein [Gimesia chilikensis]
MNKNHNIIELLRTFAHRTDPDRVFDAEQALQPFGDEIVPALTKSLNDPDPDLRILALKILEHIDQNTEPALPAMIEALEDDHRTVKIAALTPVASFGAKAIDAVPILEKWIGSDDEFSHVSAAGHILMIDPTRSKELLSVLLKALESDDIGIRCQTAWLLGQLGELERDVVPALERMLDDENSSVRSVAADAILDITDNDITHVTI